MSLIPLSDKNLFEISLDSHRKKKYPSALPRRVTLHTSLGDPKRPGEFYLQRLSQSVVTLPETTQRPASDILLGSADTTTSKDSDDVQLVVLLHFDVLDSRLSSMTSNSLYLSRAAGSGEPEILADSDPQDEPDLSLSISTITLKTDEIVTAEPYKELPKLRSVLTLSILPKKPINSAPLKEKLQRAASSSFLLSRQKTRYFNAKETKERQQLRKKVYDDNDDDVEILPNDLNLVFNVPVIRNQNEVYRYRRLSSASKSLQILRSDIDFEDRFVSHPVPPMRPCPLPGKLSQSSLAIDTLLALMPEDSLYDFTLAEEDEEFPNIPDNDHEISQNISEFYSLRSLSYLKLVKKTREQHIYRLPNYVRSQTSVDDLSLFSPEKLDAVDQSRPIHLPPKCATDKSKHTKEFQRVLSSFEHNTRAQNESRKRLGELFIANQQQWLKYMIAFSDDKELARKVLLEKEKLRALNWESLIPDRHRFDYFMKMMASSAGDKCTEQIRLDVARTEQKLELVLDQMRVAKNTEYEKTIAAVMKRPLYVNFINDVSAHPGTNFDQELFRENFRHLLFMKAFSHSGLRKHHEIFVIPVFLILFQSHELVFEVAVLIELFDQVVLSPEFVESLNMSFASWQNLLLLSRSSMAYKIFSRFNSLTELRNINCTSVFDVMTQLNDRLPLSLSAPSTPVLVQDTFNALTSARQSSEIGDSQPGSKTASVESFAELAAPSLYTRSSSLSLVGIFLQLLVIYAKYPRSKKQNLTRLMQGFLLTVLKFYHINWNSVAELVKNNKSIKLNNTSDQLANLDSFLDKWRDTFKRM